MINNASKLSNSAKRASHIEKSPIVPVSSTKTRELSTECSRRRTERFVRPRELRKRLAKHQQQRELYSVKRQLRILPPNPMVGTFQYSMLKQKNNMSSKRIDRSRRQLHVISAFHSLRFYYGTIKACLKHFSKGLQPKQKENNMQNKATNMNNSLSASLQSSF